MASATVVVAALAWPCAASADLIDLIPQLQSPIEIDAARANQSVYDSLTTPAGPTQAGTCDPLLQADPGEGACTGEVFRVFDSVRHLVHTANELTGEGPTTFTLGLDRERLGRALRWTAAEELAAQGSAATRFASSQLNDLASRIAALRFGARGLKVVSARSSSADRFVARDRALYGGGASADEIGVARRWGGFIDGSIGYGRQDDTTNLADPGTEDAFDYEGVDATIGIDYRFGLRTVVGLIVGYTRRSIDFDSNVSIVDGSIDSAGESAIAYVLWESGAVYLSTSLGIQSLEHDLVRRIAYPSFNPLVAPVDETAFSATDSDSLLGSFSIGYSWRRGGFSLEPFLRGEFHTIDIDGFSERNADGFDFTYGDQTIESFDTAIGVRVQHAFTPSFGVLVPYLRGEIHRDFGNDRRAIDAVYSGVVATMGLQGAQNFNIATNEPDEQFYLGAAGFSLVFAGGLQGFVQYQQTFKLEHIDDRAVAGGIRFEF
jgi:uncharacterized protein YhjY with autotransporter beta-barrel domain